MKKNTQIILLILITFIILFTTSFLLDISFIEKSNTRTFLVFLLMIIEAGLGLLLLKQFIEPFRK